MALTPPSTSSRDSLGASIITITTITTISTFISIITITTITTMTTITTTGDRLFAPILIRYYL